MANQEVVYTDKVFPPSGPYSQAIKVSNATTFIYTSTCVALDAEWNVVGVGDIKAQTRKSIENLEAILVAAGATLKDVVKLTWYLTDISMMSQVAEVRAEMFGDHHPASGTIPINALALPELLLEVEAVAAI